MPPSPPDLRRLLDALPACVARLNRVLRITYANAAMCGVFGLPEAEVLGLTGHGLGLPPEQWGPLAAAALRAFETGQPQTFDCLSQIHGREQLVQFRITPEFGPDGTADSVLVLAVTDDELYRLRAALRDQKLLFDAFMDHGPMIAWMRDAEGRYVYLNERYLRHYSLAAEEIVGKLVGERWPADVAEGFLRNDRQVLAGEQTLQVYEQAPDPDGTTHTWLNVKFPFADEDGRRFVGGVGIDITDRVRAEQAKRDLERHLLQAQKMESLGVLAGGLAHDFNNLLTVIVGNVGLGLRNLPPDSPTADHLRLIEQAAGRAADLCQQMLAYAGRGRLVVRDLNLSDVARDTAGMVGPVFPLTAHLALQLAPDLPPIRGDLSQMRQVILNLLTNAADALGGEGGTISVCTEAVTADEAFLRDGGFAPELPAGRYVMLTVSDSGCGMDEHTRSRLFDPFFTTKPTGRGLGLAAVLGIVRGHRGGVAVQSLSGHGSSFRVLFPVAGTVDLTELHGADGLPARFGRARTVLVVDPEEPVRQLARAALDRAGFAVLTADAAGAADAVRRLPGQVAAAVVDPTVWPGGAAEAVGTLREVRSELPVILLVHDSAEVALGQLPRGSVAACLRKPFRVSDLLELVFDVVGP